MALLPLNDAFEKTFQSLPKPEQIHLPLSQSLDYILAEEVMADMDLPPFDKSAVDGYAIYPSNTPPPYTLKVVGLSKAGMRWSGVLKSGEACQIMTGAPVPEGTERVIMVEDTTRSGEEVTIQASGNPKQHIQPQGREVSRGTSILQPGTQISASEISALATFGKAKVQVFRKPKIAVLATGDELVEPEIQPGPDQIRNSNGYGLTAQIMQNGFECNFLGVAKDTRESTREKIEEGLGHDVLVLSGGVSMGEFDYVKEILEEKGVHFEFTKIALKPGKPLVFGKVAHTFIFGLPGNPGSSFTTCELFVIPFLKGFAGKPSYRPEIFQGTLDFEIKAKGNRIQYLPVFANYQQNQWKIQKISYAGSADIVALTKANSFLIIEPERHFKPGDIAPFQLFS